MTTLPHATLLDRTIQWMYNKDAGRYLQLVVSASRDLTNLSRHEIIDIAIGDLRLYFPRVRDANLVKAHVVKEQRAVFRPRLKPNRCGRRAVRDFPKCFLRETGRAPAGRRLWKARFAAAISRPNKLAKIMGKTASFLIADG